MLRESSKNQRIVFALAVALFFCVVAILLVSAAMQKGLDHDENMYVAAGVLLAREGLLPYKDYAYFQMPNMVFAYAALFIFADHLLLAARLFSTACALVMMGLVFYTAMKLFPGQTFGYGDP